MQTDFILLPTPTPLQSALYPSYPDITSTTFLRILHPQICTSTRGC